jgi:hypothetical protein
MPAYCAIVELGGHPVCDQSAEQHGELCALVVIASTNPQFTTDPYDKRPNNVQSQSFAGGWIESVRQNQAMQRGSPNEARDDELVLTISYCPRASGSGGAP